MISLQKKIDFLNKTTFFGNISEENKVAICKRMGVKQITQHTLLFQEGDLGKEFFLIVEGEIEIIKNANVIATLTQGEIFGEMAVLCQGKRTAAAKAKQNTTVFFFKQEALESIIYEFPTVALKILKVMSQRFQPQTATEELTGTHESESGLSSQYKKCPNCYEKNDAEVQKCAYCEYSFSQNFWHKLFVAMFCILTIASSITFYWYLVKTYKETTKNDQQKIPVVFTTKVHKKDVPLLVEGYGRVRSPEVKKIQARVPGRIIKFHKDFHVGMYIKQGEILAQLDPYDYEKRVQKAANALKAQQIELSRLQKTQKSLQEQIKIATTNRDLAKEAFRRAKMLSEQGALSQLDLYRAQQNYMQTRLELLQLQNSKETFPHQLAAAKTSVTDAQIELKNAKRNMQWLSIVAPFSGRICSINRTTNIDTTTVIATLEQLDTLEIPVFVPIGHLAKLFIHKPGVHEIPDHKVQIIHFNEEHRQIWQGKIVRFEPVNKKNQCIPVIVQVENTAVDQKLSLQTNSFVKVVFEGRKEKDVWIISREWLRENNTIHVVRNDKLMILPVQIVHRFAEKLVVNATISNQDAIVVTLLSFPIPGMQLKSKEIKYEHN